MKNWTIAIAIASLTITVAACERANPPQPPPPAGGSASEAPIKTVAVTERIFMLMGRGGNIGVAIADDGILMIDDKFADLTDPVRAALAELSPGKLTYVLNTHHHGDHTGGNPTFGKEATIVAHDNVRKRLVENKTAAAGLPVITFDHEMSIHWGGEELRLVHLPGGHTDGDSAIYFTKSNVVHLGDNMFNGRLPFVDIKHGGDPRKLLASTARLLETLPKNVKLIPGHGDLASIEDLRRFHAMLEDTIGVVTAAKASGKSRDEVGKAAFGGKYKAWASDFVSEARWAETIYDSLP